MHSKDWWNSLFAAIDGKDTAAFLSFLTEDAEFRFANNPPAVGHAAVGAAGRRERPRGLPGGAGGRGAVADGDESDADRFGHGAVRSVEDCGSARRRDGRAGPGLRCRGSVRRR